jgi:hypothetical protein
MWEFESFTLNEREWRHVKARFKRFNKDHNKCSNVCPMGWHDSHRLLPQVNDTAFFKTGLVETGTCMCQQFPEFSKTMRGLDCPCECYPKDTAFRQLRKFIKRIEKEEADERR